MGSFMLLSNDNNYTQHTEPTSPRSVSMAQPYTDNIDGAIIRLLTFGNDDGESSSSNKQVLPFDYIPQPYDVVCVRGRSWWTHPGNIRYRALVAASTPAYKSAVSKQDKTAIVSETVQSVRQCMTTGESNNAELRGKFIKKDSLGRWAEVTDHFMREKISQSFRDNLHGQYRSSTKSKKQRRTALANEEAITLDINRVVNSNKRICQRTERLATDVQIHGGDNAPDEIIQELFREANASILSTIKKDITAKLTANGNQPHFA